MIPTLTLERAQTLLQAMAGKRLVLLGDLMLDEYIWGEVRRISPEAPIPVVEVRRRSYLPGGAGNVACNLLALGVQAAVVAVVGDDEAGRELLRELSDRKADIEGVIIEAGRPTTHKSRVMAHRQQVVRIDREGAGEAKADTAERLRAALGRAMASCDGALVADYDKGVICRTTTGDLAELAKQGRPVCVDPKPQNIGLFKGVTLISPNEDEALRASHQPDYAAAGRWLLEDLQVEAALITLGPRGMSLFRAAKTPVELGTFAAEDSVGDSTGCGDTVSAVFAATLVAGGSFEEAMVLANCGAGITAGRVGVHAPTPEEILATLQAQARLAK
jgi:D-glycero-beta-D-manno-heptose-7-phosphate kinase